MKFFCVCFGMMIGMLGIWVEVGTAQTITDQDMPDANLRDNVLYELKQRGVIPNNAATTTFTRAHMADARFNLLHTWTDRIGDLTGLEYATSLTELRADNGSTSNTTIKISDISVLSSLTSLTKLYLPGNKISDISALSSLTSLTTLSLSGNNISNISALSELKSLTALSLSDNNISNISALSGLINLTYLDLSRNKISDISAVYRLTALTELRLYSNKISDISAVSELTSLIQLWIGDNKISTTDAVVGLINLERLFLQGHRIMDVGEFQKLRPLSNLNRLSLNSRYTYNNDLTTWRNNLDNPDGLQQFLWVRPSAIDAQQAVSFEDAPEDPPPQTFPFTIRFSEPVYGFQMDDIIVETELDAGTGAATLEALTPTTEPEQTYIATILLPDNAAGTVRVIVRAEAAEAEDGRIDPAVDRTFPWIAFTTLPPPTPQRKIITYQCPVGWQRSDLVRADGFARRTPQVLIYEVNLGMDMSNRVSIYKPTSVTIYVHPDEGLENLEGWKLQVAIPYNRHRDYLLTAENSVVVDSTIEGVEGGFAFIENPEEDPFPMVGMGFTGALVPGFDYRLYDDTGRKVDFGIACYKRGDIFQVLKNMEAPRIFKKVDLETLDWDVPYIRSEWTVPVPVNVPGAPSLHGVNVVGKWADLKKQ